MTVSIRIAIVAVLLGILMSASLTTAQSDISPSTIVARVEDDTITVYDLVQSASAKNMLRKEPSQPPYAKLRSLLDDVIFNALLDQEAEAIDLSQDWTYRTKERAIISETARQLFQDEEFLFRLNIDSATVDSYFQEHKDRFMVPRPQRHMRQITVYKEHFGVPTGYLTPIDSLYVGWDPKRKIDSLYTRLRNGESFTKLAVLYSEEPRARSLYGDWGWISKEGLADSQFARILFEQPIHRISKPIELPYAWVILQVLGERETGETPFDATVVSTIQDWLVREQGRGLAESLVDSLMDNADIVYFEENLERPDTLIEMSTPLAMINQSDTVRGTDYFYYRNNHPDYIGRRTIPANAKRAIIDKILRSLSLYAALREWGYHDRPEVVAARNRIRSQHVKDAIKVQFDHDLLPDSAEIVQYYRDHLKAFTPERRHYISRRTLEHPDSAKALAERWRNGGALQNVFSQWVKADDLPTAVWNRLASVTEGSVIGPLAVNNEYWVVKLERIAQAKPLREVRGQIINRIRDQRYEAMRSEWMNDAAKRYTVERRLDVLKHVVLPSMEQARTQWFVDGEPVGQEAE